MLSYCKLTQAVYLANFGIRYLYFVLGIPPLISSLLPIIDTGILDLPFPFALTNIRLGSYEYETVAETVVLEAYEAIFFVVEVFR